MLKNGKKLHEALSQVIASKLNKYVDRNVTDETVDLSIYTDIFEVLCEIFDKSSIRICNEAMNYVAQLYYDSVTINNNQKLNPNIFTQRAKLNNVPTNELVALATLFSGMDFAYDFIQEIKKRS